jgi:tetratricopeptide (TPR) repeat protein
MIAASVVIALLAAIQVARLTIASGYSEDRPELAASLAPGIPLILASKAMAEVGQAAAAGDSLGKPTLEVLRTLASRAPLAIEPFLVEAALDQREGQYSRAEKLLLEARRRNPRSHAARYLLAETWLRQEKALPALGEMAVLARLIPSSEAHFIPALSQYARAPGAQEELRHFLMVNPGLRQPLLNALSADPDNVELILALTEGSVSDDADPKTWQPRLLGALVERGDYQRAYSLWRRFSGLGDRPTSLLFNGDFRESPAPGPFNWTYTSGTAGLAETAGGRLRVLYYGRENVVLAQQLLLLPPGSYRFASPTSGNAARGALVWSLVCERSSNSLMELELERGFRANFSIPNDCPAQRLELRGRQQEMPKATDVQIGPVMIERTAA